MVKDPWPRWQEPMPKQKNQTNVPFLNSNFTANVNHPNNRILIKTQFDWMKVNIVIMHELAKKSWNGFKSAYMAQEDAEKQIMHKTAAINSQQQLHHKEKYKKLADAKIIEAYKQKHGIDSLNLVAVDPMSDEASGPEDGEDKLKWKCRMAEKEGMGDMAESILEKLSFFEIIHLNWCSKEVSEN
ncbi:hypothetical protein A0H81_14880 [Grifola frondosa]|uniref:Uncharacterized protein n=1 Tax=Grifola frondosa TaxID=5627 RepID=A0A1C7LK75_GRIFR|nr:hypothetical protein A0H81_14880 [Grifola frondosa]